MITTTLFNGVHHQISLRLNSRMERHTILRLYRTLPDFRFTTVPTQENTSKIRSSVTTKKLEVSGNLKELSTGRMK